MQSPQLFLPRFILRHRKKYDEGQSLVDLNKNLARDHSRPRKKILQDNENQSRQNQKRLSKLKLVLAKIENGLSSVSSVDKSGLDRSKLSISVENGSGVAGNCGESAQSASRFGI